MHEHESLQQMFGYTLENDIYSILNRPQSPVSSQPTEWLMMPLESLSTSVNTCRVVPVIQTDV